MHTALVVACLALCSLVPGCQRQATDRSRLTGMATPWEQYAAADSLLESHQASMALPTAARLVADYPDTVRFHRLYQNCLLALGRRDEALRVYRHRLEAQPSTAARWYLLGRLLNDDLSAAHFRRAASLDPGHAWAYFGTGGLSMRREDYHQAASLYRRAIRFGLPEPAVYERLGACLSQLGDVAGATAAYQTYLAIAPTGPAQALVRHRLAYLEGDYRPLVACVLISLVATSVWAVLVRWRVQRRTRFSCNTSLALLAAGGLGAGYLVQWVYPMYDEPLMALATMSSLPANLARHAFFVGPIEEACKWLAALVLVIPLRLVRTPLDGVAAAALVAAGFAGSETAFYMWHDGLQATTGRLFTGVLMHATFSALWGYGLGLAHGASRRRRMLILCVTLSAGALCHGVWNSSVEIDRWLMDTGAAGAWRVLVGVAQTAGLLLGAKWLVGSAQRDSVGHRSPAGQPQPRSTLARSPAGRQPQVNQMGLA